MWFISVLILGSLFWQACWFFFRPTSFWHSKEYLLHFSTRHWELWVTAQLSWISQGFTYKHLSCYATTTLTSWLELDMRIQQLSLTSVLSRLHDDTLSAGSLLQEWDSMSDRGSISWDDWLRVFHLSNRCCMDRITATERNRLQAKIRLGWDWVSRFTSSHICEELRPEI